MNDEKTYESDILAAIHETVSDLYEADLVDKSTMKEFDEMCLTHKGTFESEEIQTNINQYNPDYVSPPGDTLEEVLEERGITQAELAQRMGRPQKTINEIIKGKTAITEETALQLELVLGIPAHFWSNRERHYRECLARQEEQKRLKRLNCA